MKTLFQNRDHASELLLRKLLKYRGQSPVVIAIPRGAVPMAFHIAEKLEGDLDLVFVRKIGAPGNPEYAIGSVSEYGDIYWRKTVDLREYTQEALQAAAKEEIEKVRQRRELFSPDRHALDLKDRIVIVVDDGIATGATLMGALQTLRRLRPKKLIVAAPVAAPSSLIKIEPLADEMVILEAPEWMFSISEFYESFDQVSDEDVTRIMTAWREKHPDEEKRVASEVAPLTRAG